MVNIFKIRYTPVETAPESSTSLERKIILTQRPRKLGIQYQGGKGSAAGRRIGRSLREKGHYCTSGAPGSPVARFRERTFAWPRPFAGSRDISASRREEDIKRKEGGAIKPNYSAALWTQCHPRLTLGSRYVPTGRTPGPGKRSAPPTTSPTQQSSVGQQTLSHQRKVLYIAPPPFSAAVSAPDSPSSCDDFTVLLDQRHSRQLAVSVSFFWAPFLQTPRLSLAKKQQNLHAEYSSVSPAVKLETHGGGSSHFCYLRPFRLIPFKAISPSSSPREEAGQDNSLRKPNFHGVSHLIFLSSE